LSNPAFFKKNEKGFGSKYVSPRGLGSKRKFRCKKRTICDRFNSLKI
jgi:hypothetical protein